MFHIYIEVDMAKQKIRTPYSNVEYEKYVDSTLTVHFKPLFYKISPIRVATKTLTKPLIAS
jgi:hypothetical protein